MDSYLYPAKPHSSTYSTNMLSALLGLLVYVIIRPGQDVTSGMPISLDTGQLHPTDVMADFLRNIFPDNVLGAGLYQTQTRYLPSPDNSTEEVLRSLERTNNSNLLGVILICAAVGIATARVGEPARPITAFFQAGNVVVFQLFHWAKWVGPVGAASLIAHGLLSVPRLGSALTHMGLFLAALCGGCLVMAFVILPALHMALARRNPLRLLSLAVRPCLISVGPPSSAISLPEQLQICENVFHVDPRVSGFVLPTIITISRSGTTMFMAMASLFMAAYSGTALSATMIAIIIALTVLFAMATPSVPSSSIVCILLILDSLGVPPANLGLILALECITDRVRTMVNIVGMLNCVIIVWHWTGSALAPEGTDSGRKERIDVKNGGSEDLELELLKDIQTRHQQRKA